MMLQNIVDNGNNQKNRLTHVYIRAERSNSLVLRRWWAGNGLGVVRQLTESKGGNFVLCRVGAFGWWEALPDGKGLKCNAFGIKRYRALRLTLRILGPASCGHRSGLVKHFIHIYIYIYKRERETLQGCVSAYRLCNLMLAAFALATSSSSLLFKPDGD